MSFNFMQVSHFSDKFPHVTKNNWQGVYFHGDLEDIVHDALVAQGIEDCAVDLAASAAEVPDAGVYPATVYGHAATLFVWRSRQSARGYIVLNSDEESIAFAQKQFKVKPDFI